MSFEQRADELDYKALKLSTIMFSAIQEEIRDEDPEFGIKAVILALCKLSSSSLHFMTSHYGNDDVVDVFIQSLRQGIDGLNEMEEAADLAEDIINKLKKNENH